jgi:hypothetical protein
MMFKSGNHKNAKMQMLEALMSEMQGKAGEGLKGLQKVTVAAPDKTGLEVGLDKAKDMISKDAECPCPEGEECSCPDNTTDEKEEEGEYELPETAEEIDKMMAILEQKKAALAQK